MTLSKAELVSYIDHTLLKPDVTPEQIKKLCQEAAENSFKAVCINPGYVSLAAEILKGTGVAVATVIGFPLGATTSRIKGAETAEAVENGAGELDVVLNIGRLKAGDSGYVLADLRQVVQSAQGRQVKVIIETALLTDNEKVKACQLAVEAGAAFVKTSTGFAKGGATVTDVQLMRQTVGPKVGVKASGGIRDLAALKAMVAAGANRIGTSSAVAILAELG